MVVVVVIDRKAEVGIAGVGRGIGTDTDGTELSDGDTT